ncbi:MAG: hypothetical protein ACRDOK_13395 [Streptosporangiaceae bacterium]
MRIARKVSVLGENAPQPARHCDCGMCTPSWARRRGKSSRYSEMVTLVAAIDREDTPARPAMAG